MDDEIREKIREAQSREDQTPDDDGINEAVLTKKILNAPCTEADYFRIQYNKESCILLLYHLGLNRTYAIGMDKDGAKGMMDVLEAYINDVETVDFKTANDVNRMYG